MLTLYTSTIINVTNFTGQALKQYLTAHSLPYPPQEFTREMNEAQRKIDINPEYLLSFLSSPQTTYYLKKEDAARFNNPVYTHDWSFINHCCVVFTVEVKSKKNEAGNLTFPITKILQAEVPGFAIQPIIINQPIQQFVSTLDNKMYGALIKSGFYKPNRDCTPYQCTERNYRGGPNDSFEKLAAKIEGIKTFIMVNHIFGKPQHPSQLPKDLMKEISSFVFNESPRR